MDKQKKTARNITGKLISSTLQDLSNYKNVLSS